MITDYFTTLTDALSRIDLQPVGRALDVLVAAQKRGACVWLCGNGGSISTAAHFANDLLKAGVRASCLGDNPAVLTAAGNDVGFERVYSNQLAVLIHPKDVLVAISTSGNSENVLAALEVCRLNGGVRVGLTGTFGGLMQSMVDVCIRVPAESQRMQEDGHLAICHALAAELKKILTESKSML